MAENSVGSVYLDLVVRDTVETQVSDISKKATECAKKSFSGMEATIGSTVSKAIGKVSKLGETIANGPAKAMERAAGKMKSSTKKAFRSVSNSASSCGQQVENSVNKSFNRAVAKAEAKVTQLEAAFKNVTSKLNKAKATDNDAAAQRLGAQQERIYDQLEAARAKLSNKIQAAARKEANAQDASNGKVRKGFSLLGKVANGFKNSASKAFNGAKRVVSGFGKSLTSIKNKISSAGKAANRFGTRLKSIISGALVFNLLSSALRKMTDYFGGAIRSSSEMQGALANLKGAAMTATAPIVEMLTPALSALANGAATALSYLTQLISFFSGKSVSAMSNAAKKIQETAGAAKKAMSSIAGFDEIQKLDGNAKTESEDTAEIKPNFDFKGKSSFLDSVMEAVKGGNWGQIGVILGEKLNQSISAIPWPDIQGKVRGGIQGIARVINGIVGSIDFGSLGASIGNGFNTLVDSIGTFFQKVDFGKIGASLGAGLQSVVKTINWKAFVKSISAWFKSAFNGLRRFVAAFDFSGLGQTVSDCINQIDWVGAFSEAAGALSDATVALLDLLIGFVYGLDWNKLGRDIWNSVIAILQNIDWAGVISKAFELLGGAIGGAAQLVGGLCLELWKSLKAGFETIKMTYFEPYMNDMGKMTVEGFFKGIGDMFADIGNWIYENIFKPFIDGFKKAFGIHSPSKVMEEQGNFIIAGLLNGITATWKAVVRFFEDIVNWFTEMFADIGKTAEKCWDDVKGVWSAVSGWFNDTVIQPVTGFFSRMWDGLKNGAKDAWEGIKNAFSSVADWFKDVFTKAWQGVKDVFSTGGRIFNGIKDGIASVFKTVVNGIIDGINKVIKVPFDGINKALQKIKGIEIAGIKPFNWISTISVPQIPRLAKGGVITQPTLAMMGEYSGAGSNPEIVAPQSIIEQTLTKAMGGYYGDMVQCFEAVLEVLRNILEAVYGIDFDSSQLIDQYERYKQKQAIALGGC